MCNEEKKVEVKEETKKLNVTVSCLCMYKSSIDVPANLSLEEAIEYATEHIDEIPLGTIDKDCYIPGSDELDDPNCSFDVEDNK